jgi:hypothetical protein
LKARGSRRLTGMAPPRWPSTRWISLRDWLPSPERGPTKTQGQSNSLPWHFGPARPDPTTDCVGWSLPPGVVEESSLSPRQKFAHLPNVTPRLPGPNGSSACSISISKFAVAAVDLSVSLLVLKTRTSWTRSSITYAGRNKTPLLGHFRSVFKLKGGQRFWETEREGFSPAFRLYVDSISTDIE